MPQVTNAEIKELITEQAGIVNSNFKKAKAAINTKVDKVDGKGLSTEDFTTDHKGKLEALPTNAELQAGYVAKEAGKGLSTNDFTDALKTKLEGVETGAQVNVLEGVQLNGTDITIDANKKANIVLPAAAEYTMIKQDTAETGYASTYYLSKDGVQVGAKINIAKDQVLDDVQLLQCTVADEPIEGLEVGDWYFDFSFVNKDEHVYLAAKDLTDVYTAGAGLTLTNGEFAVNTADTSVVDTAPTASSTKLVQSGGVKAALDGKVDNLSSAATAGTYTKVTIQANGLVSAGADLAESDIPELHLSKVTDVTATAAEVNVLDGITATTTELNYVDGVTSSIQDQLDSKVAANNAITGATKCKITYDSKGLVTAGADLEASDIPNLASSKVTAMTGYEKASAAAAISASDSLNVAVGKLEKGLDGKTSPQDVTDTIYGIFGDISITPWDDIVTTQQSQETGSGEE
jgi:hypothetical protein